MELASKELFIFIVNFKVRIYEKPRLLVNLREKFIDKLIKVALHNGMLMFGLLICWASSAQKAVGEDHLSRGIKKFDTEDYKGAIEVLKQAKETNSSDPEVYFYLAEAYLATGHNKPAMEHYNQVIRLDSSYVNAYKNRGKLKARLGDYRGSILDFNQALTLKPDFSAAYFNRALSKYHLKAYEDAINDLNQVLELLPQDGEAYYWRGVIKIKQEKHDAGCMDLSKAGEAGYFQAYDAIKKHCN